MASRQVKNRSGKSSVAISGQRQNQGLDLKSYVLIIGIVVLALTVVSAFVILGPGSGTAAQTGPVEVSSDKSIGTAGVNLVVEEYADFQCPYCKQFATGPELQLRKDYVDTGKAKLVFHHMAFIGPESLWAAGAAECANEQGRFWDYHDKLFQEQGGENSGTFSRDNLKRFAGELGLNTTQFNQCLDADKYQAKVQQEVTQAQQRGVNSTPTLFVNGQLVNRGSDYQVLQASIEAALKR